MAKIDKVQEVAINKLIPYENNAKKHSREQIEKLKASIQEFGFLTPCLIDKDYNIIAGHGRVMSAQEIGMKEVPCVFIEGLDEAQRRAYILADNRLGELGEWDMDIVAEELQWLNKNDFQIDLTGFELEDQIIDVGSLDDLGIGKQIDEMVNRPTPQSKQGEVYALGKHKLMVGDSTNSDDVLRLMAGEEADLLVTDPPYNVAVESENGDTIINDNMSPSEFRDFLASAFKNAYDALRMGGAFYIWHADSNGLDFRQQCENAGLKIRQNLVWVKNTFTLGRQDYQWRHEPCLYGWKEGASHYFIDKRNISTIIKSKDIYSADREELISIIESMVEYSTVADADKPQRAEFHPTVKPIELIERQIKNSSRSGDLVLDLFGGSGTTLLACEELGRRCNIMEFDPKYADVIIARWEEMTGEKAYLLN